MHGNQGTTRRRRRRLGALLAVTAFTAIPAATQRASADPPFDWTVTEVGLDAIPDAGALALNDAGQVGFTQRAEDESLHAMLWSPSGTTDLGTLDGVAVVSDLSESGLVAGHTRADPFGPVDSRAFRWRPTTGLVELNGLGGTETMPYAINDAGQVVGYASDSTGATSAILDDGTALTALPLPPGMSQAQAADINNSGQIVGTAYEARPTTSLLWNNPAQEPLPLTPGEFSSAVAINEAGHVIGQFAPDGVRSAFLWTPQAGVIGLGVGHPSMPLAVALNELDQVALVGLGTGSARSFLYDPDDGLVEIEGPPGTTQLNARAINDAGFVAGDMAVSGTFRAFIWSQSTGLIDLSPVSGGWLSAALAVNDAGQVLGHATDQFANRRVVLWNPPAGGITPGRPHRVELRNADADIEVHWTPAGTGALQFDVLRTRWDPAGQAWVDWTNQVVAAPSTTITDTAVPDGLYTYLVRAHNAYGPSPWVSQQIWHVSDAAPPAAPTGAVLSVTDTTARFTWTDVADNEFGYEVVIVRRNFSTFEQELVSYAALEADTKLYTAPLPVDGRYAALVRAYNPAGQSDWVIRELSFTDDSVPPPPPPEFAAVADGAITLSWLDTAHEQGYEIQRATFDPVGRTWGGWTSWTVDVNQELSQDPAPVPGRHAYLIRGFNSSGFGDWSIIVLDATG